MNGARIQDLVNLRDVVKDFYEFKARIEATTQNLENLTNLITYIFGENLDLAKCVMEKLYREENSILSEMANAKFVFNSFENHYRDLLKQLRKLTFDTIAVNVNDFASMYESLVSNLQSLNLLQIPYITFSPTDISNFPKRYRGNYYEIYLKNNVDKIAIYFRRVDNNSGDTDYITLAEWTPSKSLNQVLMEFYNSISNNSPNYSFWDNITGNSINKLRNFIALVWRTHTYFFYAIMHPENFGYYSDLDMLMLVDTETYDFADYNLTAAVGYHRANGSHTPVNSLIRIPWVDDIINDLNDVWSSINDMMNSISEAFSYTQEAVQSVQNYTNDFVDEYKSLIETHNNNLLDILNSLTDNLTNNLNSIVDLENSIASKLTNNSTWIDNHSEVPKLCDLWNEIRDKINDCLGGYPNPCVYHQVKPLNP